MKSWIRQLSLSSKSYNDIREKEAVVLPFVVSTREMVWAHQGLSVKFCRRLVLAQAAPKGASSGT